MKKRELTIVCPGVVYEKGEHGNMTRYIKDRKKRYFFYAGKKDTVKVSIYVKELVRFFKYRMIDNNILLEKIFLTVHLSQLIRLKKYVLQCRKQQI